MSKPSRTSPSSPPPGHEDQSARLAASAWVDQEGDTLISEQARYLRKLVRMLRELQNSGRRTQRRHVSSLMSECQREAGFIISGVYSSGGVGWGVIQ